MLKTAEKKRTQSFKVIDSNDNYQSNSFSSSNLSSLSSSSSSSSSTTNKSFDALIYNESYPTKCNTLLDLLNTSKDILNQFKNEIANGYNFQYPFPINCIEYGRRNNDRAVNSGVITSMFNSTLNKPNQNLFRQKVKDLLKANNHSSKSPEDLKPKLSLLNLDMKMPDTSSAEDVVKGLDPTAIDKLMDKKFASILKRTDNLIVRISDKSSKVLVAGDVNAGKSTFVNTLLRREVMPVDQQPCTTLFCEVLGVHENDDVEEVHAIKDIKLYDRKDRSTYTVMDLDSIPNVMNSEVQQYSLLKVYCKDRRQAQNSLLHNGIIDIALIDCPGLNRDTLKTTALFARQEEIDVIIFVVSAENHFTLSAKEFLSNASNEKAYLFIVVNRFDNIKNKSKCKRLVLEQIKEVSPRTFENAKDLVHFVSASAVEIPAGDGIVTVVENSSDDDDSIKQFNSCEEALRSFIVEKRTNSKLAPAQHFLENLVLDISLLSELNLDHALQEHKRAAMELEERKFDYEKLVEDEKRVTEKAGRMIDDYCEGVTRLCGQQVREAIRNVNKDIKIEFPGFFSVWNYATDVRDAMLDKILEQIRNSESYSIHATHECIAKLRSMGENLPDDNRNTEVDVDSMFSNVNRSLNIPVEISDFVDLDFHEKFNSGLLNVAGLTGASLIAFGSNAKTLHSLLKFSNILSVYNMRKVILPVLGLASIGLACYLVLDIQNTIPRKVSRKIQKVLEQENYVDKQMNRIARQVRKKSRLVSNDLLFRYRLAVEREKKQRESLIHVVDKSQEALLFFEQILCSSEKMANILSDFDKI